MGGDNGHGVTFERSVGFVDRIHCFPRVEVVWQIVGTVFFLVTFCSFIPQTAELVKSRSSFGIESLAILCQSLGHFLQLVNLLCFKAWDFVGFFQYPTWEAFPRILTFFNLFFQWVMFLPTIYQAFMYHDREVRETRGKDDIKLDWWKTAGGAILLTIVDVILVLAFFVFSMIYGWERSEAMNYAEVCGTVATVLEFGFFIPQVWTTCKLRDGGSLSLLMLEIQGPADMLNAVYMWLGSKDHWTTWICIMVNGLEEVILLSTCLLFKCLKAREAKLEAAAQKRSMSLLASLEPERLDLRVVEDDSSASLSFTPIGIAKHNYI